MDGQFCRATASAHVDARRKRLKLHGLGLVALPSQINYHFGLYWPIIPQRQHEKIPQNELCTAGKVQTLKQAYLFLLVCTFIFMGALTM